MNKNVTNFIKEISLTKAYGFKFLRFYNNPNSFFGEESSHDFDYKEKPYYYVEFGLNNDFSKLLKLCLADENFSRKLTSMSCYNIADVLKHSIDFKKNYSKDVMEHEYIEVTSDMSLFEISSACYLSRTYDEYKSFFENFSEEEVDEFDENAAQEIRTRVMMLGSFIYNEKECFKSLKKIILDEMEEKGLSDLEEESENGVFWLSIENDKLEISSELIYSLVCENRFLYIINGLLKENKIVNNKMLKKVYKIIELGVMIKEKESDDLERYNELLSKDSINQFDLISAKQIMSKITSLLTKPKGSNLILLRGRKEV